MGTIQEVWRGREVPERGRTPVEVGVNHHLVVKAGGTKWGGVVLIEVVMGRRRWEEESGRWEGQSRGRAEG